MLLFRNSRNFPRNYFIFTHHIPVSVHQASTGKNFIAREQKMNSRTKPESTFTREQEGQFATPLPIHRQVTKHVFRRTFLISTLLQKGSNKMHTVPENSHAAKLWAVFSVTHAVYQDYAVCNHGNIP
jgi:hypothetical protein